MFIIARMKNSNEIQDELNKQIEQTASKIEKQRKLLKSSQTKIKSNLSGFQEVKSKVIVAEGEEETLTGSVIAMRQKLESYDGSAKEQAQELHSSLRAYFKNLGLNVSTGTSTDFQERIEMKITFTENSEYHATFDYIPHTEEYDCEFV